MTKWLTGIFLCACFSGAQADDSDAEIEYLLKYVTDSDVVFVRNGKDYSGPDAASHMNRKRKAYGSRVKTAEDFIKYAATESTMSGKLYSVTLPDGREMPSAEFLNEVLAGYRETGE